MGKIIELKGVSKSYDGEQVLHNIDLYIRDKEFITLLGPSGCGKTTTLRLIGGFETPDEGEVFFDGVSVTSLPPHKRPVNTVFQKYALFPHLNVYDNIAFGLRLKKMPQDQIDEMVRDALQLVSLRGFGSKNVNTLSGGQQQRVAIARALVKQPKFLIFDDSASALDYATEAKLRASLSSLSYQPTTFIISQRTSSIMHADRILVLDDGALVGVGSHDTLLRDCEVYREIYRSQFPEGGDEA